MGLRSGALTLSSRSALPFGDAAEDGRAGLSDGDTGDFEENLGGSRSRLGALFSMPWARGEAALAALWGFHGDFHDFHSQGILGVRYLAPRHVPLQACNRAV